MYDFANSGYDRRPDGGFQPYFVGVVAGGAGGRPSPDAGDAASSLVVMSRCRAIGAYADLHARKKSLLATSTACVRHGGAGLVVAAAPPCGHAMLMSNALPYGGRSTRPSCRNSRADLRRRPAGASLLRRHASLKPAYVLPAQARGVPATQSVPDMWHGSGPPDDMLTTGMATALLGRAASPARTGLPARRALPACLRRRAKQRRFYGP